MIHKYSMHGMNIVLDINSGAVHVVDDIVYDALDYYKEKSAEEACLILKDKYSETDVREAYAEIKSLEDEKMLFTEDIYADIIPNLGKRNSVVKALCLHIAHDCNLKCKYCFAEEGEYHGRRALMSYEAVSYTHLTLPTKA